MFSPIVSADSISETELLSAAASVEQNSEHPLATALVNSARERGVKPPAVVDFQSTTGGGVMGRVDGRRVLVGKPAFLRAQHVAAVAQLETKASPLQHQGNTVVFVARDNRAAGIIAIADPIKESTLGAIENLHQFG